MDRSSSRYISAVVRLDIFRVTKINDQESELNDTKRNTTRRHWIGWTERTSRHTLLWSGLEIAVVQEINGFLPLQKVLWSSLCFREFISLNVVMLLGEKWWKFWVMMIGFRYCVKECVFSMVWLWRRVCEFMICVKINTLWIRGTLCLHLEYLCFRRSSFWSYHPRHSMTSPA